ncbi:DUF4468 domain-containing protein [Myroides marinus]|uniref:hypothetical protein n=1 Tax=Myroides marinus TaxID=703342 RepID=UPI0025762BD6|nr:hypothetical protein [Myroides marinus]MDM1502271.1 DUF4468 domain-containing protein [Myroides marinus]
MFKKLLLTIMVLLPVVASAQYLEVTPEGLKEKGTNNTYNVLDFPGKTAEELYNASVLFVNEKFKFPEKVIKADIKDKKLRYSENTAFKVSNGGIKVTVDITFHNELSFKDGKVKYEVVALDMGYMKFKGGIWSSYPIWNEKNGKLRLEEEKNALEYYFNSLIKEYVDYINKSDNDEW